MGAGDVDAVARDGDGLAVELPKVIRLLTEAPRPGPDNVILLLLGGRQQLQALARGRQRLAVEAGPFREPLLIVHGQTGAHALGGRQAGQAAHAAGCRFLGFEGGEGWRHGDGLAGGDRQGLGPGQGWPDREPGHCQPV